MSLRYYLFSSLISMMIGPLLFVFFLSAAKGDFEFNFILGDVIIFMIYGILPILIIGLPSSIAINQILMKISRRRTYVSLESLLYLIFSVAGSYITILVISNGENLDFSSLFLVFCFGYICALVFQLSTLYFKKILKQKLAIPHL